MSPISRFSPFLLLLSCSLFASLNSAPNGSEKSLVEKSLLEKSLIEKQLLDKLDRKTVQNDEKQAKKDKVSELLMRARQRISEFGENYKSERDDIVWTTGVPTPLPTPSPPPLPTLPKQFSSVSAFAVVETQETSVIRRWVDKDGDIARAEFIELEPEGGGKFRNRIYNYPTQEVFDIVEDDDRCNAFPGKKRMTYDDRCTGT